MAQSGRPKGRGKDASIQIRITDDLNRKFDVYCVENGTTKTKVLTAFIKMIVCNKKDNQEK